MSRKLKAKYGMILKIKAKYRVLFLLTLVSTAGFFSQIPSYARDDCSEKISGVCDHAQRIASSLAPKFPMRINQNTVIQTIYASGSVVYLNARFDYDGSEMRNALEIAGKSEEETISAISRVAESSICNPSSETYRFVASGGTIVYSYFFIDGNKYSDIEVNGC